MIEPNIFLSNLAKTCTGHGYIGQHGKNLSIFKRVADRFQGMKSSEHFRLACQRLAEIASEGDLSPLTSEQSLEILGRFREIQKKLTGDTKTECDTYLKQVEEKVLNRDKIDKLSEKIFTDITSASEKTNKKGKERAIRNLDALVNYFKDDSEAIGKVIISWSSMQQAGKFPTQKIARFYRNANLEVIKTLLTKEEEILRSKVAKDVNFEKFPSLFWLHIEAELRHLNKNEILNQFILLKEIMDRHADNKKFISSCLQNIDQFLANTLFSFSGQKFLSEMKKNDLLVFRDLFSIVDCHMTSIDISSSENAKLINDLKIKFANLPCPTVRSAYPHLLLTEKDQLDIIIGGLQSEEDRIIHSLVEFLLSNNPSGWDIHRLAKLVSEKSGLNDINRRALRLVFKERLKDQSPSNWEDFLTVRACLENAFLEKQGSTPLINDLARTSKAKVFFKSQVGLEEDMILIPRWYHATSRRGITGILRSGEIQVRHEKAFSGAWVSTHIESNFGEYTVSLSKKVADIDPNVFIGYQFDRARWRGIQKAIPITAQVVVGVPAQVDKIAQKTDKLKLVRILKDQGFPNPQALSMTQVQFMQNEVLRILGTPNLSDTWWGTGKAYSEHQVKLQTKVQSTPVVPDLFTVQPDSSNQIKIAKVIQSIALPLYKDPMPQDPSYRSEATTMRVELGISDRDTYKHHCEDVEQKKAPARGTHGTMHCVRVALLTQVLSKAYEKLGRAKVQNPILLATAGAFHDVSRENESIDYWDGESSEALEKLLVHFGMERKTIDHYVQAIREKDPKNGQFSTDDQRIVHDADCLDIIRVIGKWNFSKRHLCFYNFPGKDKQYVDKLIGEISNFIEITENLKLRNFMEHNSPDFYGDLVRLLFEFQKKDPSKFPIITQLIEDDMKPILTKERRESFNKVLNWVLSVNFQVRNGR